MKPALNQKQVDKVIELWRAGMTGPEIAERFGVTRGTIFGHVFRARQKSGERKVPEHKTRRG